MKVNSALISPFWYAVGAFFVTPVTAALCALSGVLLILLWPVIPFLCYFQRKEELKKIATEGEGCAA